jgi:predicted ABC-type transport system involved in lysophospholipase L1 biosynthesis ATPase subunit
MRVIEARELTKVYGRGENRVEALTGMSMNVEPGEWIAIMGPSGSGKSTLMNLIGLLDRPTSGSYTLNGREVSRLRGRAGARPQGSHRVRLPELQPPAQGERAGERGAPDGLRRRGQEGATQAGSRAA